MIKLSLILASSIVCSGCKNKVNSPVSIPPIMEIFSFVSENNFLHESGMSEENRLFLDSCLIESYTNAEVPISPIFARVGETLLIINAKTASGRRFSLIMRAEGEYLFTDPKPSLKTSGLRVKECALIYHESQIKF